MHPRPGGHAVGYWGNDVTVIGGEDRNGTLSRETATAYGSIRPWVNAGNIVSLVILERTREWDEQERIALHKI